jgi:hypothetical protein
MEVRCSRSFSERIRAVDPEYEDLVEAPSILVVSTRGVAVEKSVADNWAKGTFASPVDSLERHFEKHGAGRTRQQYTLDALRFFEEYKELAQWGRWNSTWPEAFRLKIGARGGYYTPGGRILSYWDDYGRRETTV